MKEEKVKTRVREGYAKIAKEGLPCSPTASCCSPSTLEEISEKMGYTKEELRSLPEGANLNLGCGNPVALASVREGETVIDLGAGAGIDCFLAAKKVGEKGRVIGVDMTPAMLDKARENASKGSYENVEFRLGEIENLPVADNTADAIISNCVINLSPNKKRVFEEAFRVLKPGGRLMVSDIVLTKEIPESARKKAHPASCVAEAIMKDQYMKLIEEAGFQSVEVLKETKHSFEDIINDPNATVIVKNPEKGTEEVKHVREANEETRGIVEEILDSTSSVNASGIKPKK